MRIKDSLIAATALVHDLAVATHNRADFEKAGVTVVDPFADRRNVGGSGIAYGRCEVPEEGIEPSRRGYLHGILSPARLPVSPLRLRST